MVFPDNPAWLDEEIVDWADEETVAGAVEKFLGRVSTLFPVHDEIWDADLEVIEWRLYEIPVIPMGVDEWYDGWDDLKEPAAYLLYMRYSRGEADHPHRRDEFADLYPDHLVPRYLEPHCLVATLRELVNQHGLPEPLAALPDLIEMLDHSTGNVWIDVGEMSLADGGGYPLWERENIDWLAGEWEQAKPVLDRIHRLLDWQNSTPEEIGFKLSAVREVLLDAHRKMIASPAEPDPLPEEQPDESTT